MEDKIIKLAQAAIKLEPVEQEITEASAHYVALEEFVLNNPSDELAPIFHEVSNITGATNVIIARIHIELALKDFVNNGITEKEMTYFNKIQQDYTRMKNVLIELSNQSERLHL